MARRRSGVSSRAIAAAVLASAGCGHLDFDASDCGFGWTPLLVGSGACPAEMQDIPLVGNAALDPAACTCTCTIETPPACDRGTLSGMGGATACDVGATAGYVFDGPGCVGGGGAPPYEFAQHTPLFDAGVCAPQSQWTGIEPTADAIHACFSASRSCDAQTPGFASCIALDGDRPCPPGPFQTRSLVGTAAIAACRGCESCTNTATCSPAILHFYSDAACATEIATRPVDGTCEQLSSGDATTPANSVSYQSTTSAPACMPTAAPVAAVELDATQTLCCR